MPKEKKLFERSFEGFAEFIEEPHVGTALIVVGLIALVFSILEFTKALGY